MGRTARDHISRFGRGAGTAGGYMEKGHNDLHGMYRDWVSV